MTFRHRFALAALVLSTLTNRTASGEESRPPIRVRPIPGIGGRSLADHAGPVEVPTIQVIASSLQLGLTGSPRRSSISLRKATAAPARIIAPSSARRPGTGIPYQFNAGQSESPLLAASSMGRDVDDEEVAREFLRQNAGALHLDDPDRELTLDHQETDALGRHHVRFTQSWGGHPIWPTDLIVHLDAGGRVDLVDGTFIGPSRRVARQPLLDAAAAEKRAIADAGGAGEVSGPPALIVYTAQDRYPRLAWRIDVAQSLFSRQWTIVDATSGAILDRIGRTMSEAVIGSGVDLAGRTRQLSLWHSGANYLMLDSSKKMFDPSSPIDVNKVRGAILVFDAKNQPPTDNPDKLPAVSIVSSPNPNSFSEPAAVSAAFWLSATYDYYLRTFNRNGIDGKGSTINGMVRFGLNHENAAWLDGASLMVFGDGDSFAASVDVIGHEMTHGVTSKSANLVYKNQSGAANEAFSDVFGEMVEADVFGSNDWQIGSQLRAPIRSMSDPSRYQQPAKMSQFVQTTRDNGGVHINSGIINNAFYQLAAAMNGAIGKKDAAAIFYRTLTEHLGKDAQFIDVRLAAITSAKELFGSSSQQAAMTAKAFDAVEIFDASPPAETPRIPAVNAADSTLFLFLDEKSNRFYLARKELPADGAGGATLSRFAVGESRPSVTGDGTLAAFVNSTADVCLIATKGGADETCLGLPAQGIFVSSVGMSRDARRFGFVLQGADGTPDNDLIVVDTKTDTSRRYTLTADTQDGDSLATILFADAMSFTSDGRYIVFDAFNSIPLNDGSQIGAWSISALDLTTGSSFAVVPPQPGLDIEFPEVGKTSDNLLAFEVRESASGSTQVAAANLDTGDVNIIATTLGVLSAPSYSGNDRAIVFAGQDKTPTRTSLYARALAADGITPTGSTFLWLPDGGYPAIYRRGTFSGPTLNAGRLGFMSASFSGNAGATATITVNRVGGNQGAVSVNYRTVDGTAVGGRDYSAVSGTLSWADGDTTGKTFRVPMLSPSGFASLTMTLTSATGGATIDTASATLTIAPNSGVVNPPVPVPAKRRGVRH